MKRSLTALVIIGVLLMMAPRALGRKWTTNDGKYETEAELVDSANGEVTLQKPDGTTVTLPLTRLSPADRRYVAATNKQAAKPPATSYTRDVQPYLKKYCLECHNSNKAKGGYNVESFAALTHGGKKGALLVPAHPDQSRLLVSLQGRGKPMPPRKSPQPSAAEIEKVVAWIKAGAKDDSAADASPKSTASKNRSRS